MGKDLSIFAKPSAIKKDRDGLIWWTAGGTVYEAHAGRQAEAEWLKLKVCDLDLSGVRACGAWAKIYKSLQSPRQ